MIPEWKPIEEVGLEMDSPHTHGEDLPRSLLSIRDEFDKLTDEADQNKLVYAATGLALNAAQCFEVEIQLVILIVGKARGTLASVQAYEEADAKLSAQTLGRLLREVQQVVKFGDNGRALLELALEKRNSLVHGFFQHYSFEFPIRSGRKIMLDDLLERIALFKKADGFAQIVTKQMMEHIGFTEEHIAKALAENKAELEKKERARSEGRAPN